MHLVEEYAEKFGSVKVLTGPVFDYNSDGHADSMQEIETYSKLNVPT